MSQTIPDTRSKLSGDALAAARRANGRKGGRPPGAKNKATIRREQFAKDGLDDALASGMMPLEIMLLGIREPSKVSRTRFERAVAAAPYVHPKLTAVAYKKVDQGPKLDLSEMSDAELAALQAILATVGQSLQRRAGPLIDGEREETGRGDYAAGVPAIRVSRRNGGR
jgi:hypothetical protein